MKRVILLAVLLSLSLGAGCVIASAEEAPPDAPPTLSGDLEDIVLTDD